MKYIASIIIIILFFLSGYSQKMERYEDVLNRILVLPAGGALAQLKIYQAVEPENPSIYLQMALIYEKRYKNSDPIKNYEYKLGNAQEAIKAFTLTQKFISDKEVRRNQDMYFNFGKLDDRGRLEVSFDSIKNHMNASMTELTQFVKYMPDIYDRFTKSFHHYDLAHKQFTSILGDYATFKDLYLLYNADIEKKFDDLKNEYNSALRYWDEYLSAKDSLDIGYNQQLSIKPVKVYRLDGMESKINFLQDKINVWDYASWVDNTRKMITAEIDGLRSDLIGENTRLDNELNRARQDFVSDDFSSLKASKELLFNLRKYDLQSVVEPILIYKQKKHDLLYYQLLSESIDTSTVADTGRKLYVYGQVINKIKDADSTLLDISSRNTSVSFSKYADFIKKNYNGAQGITRYVNAEKEANSVKVQESVVKIKNGLYELLKPDTENENIKFKKQVIPLYKINAPDTGVVAGTLFTTHTITNYDGSRFVGGVTLDASKNLQQVYLCGITNDQKMGWYNEYILPSDSALGPNSHTRIGAMKAIPGGLALILHGIDPNQAHLNQLLLLDEKGNITYSKRLMINQYPRTMLFNERTNTLFVTFKGQQREELISGQSELVMANYSIYGDLLWQKRATYKGNVCDVVSIENGYFLAGNYNELKAMDGKMYRAGSGATDVKPFVLTIDLAGNITGMNVLPQSGSFFTNMIYKVSDDCINLFGSKGTFVSSFRLDENPDTSVHFIFNKNLEKMAGSF